MLNVALTGNIAAGKSTVVNHFREWGATVVDADELVRQAQAPGTDVLTAIAKRFGGAMIGPEGELDRAALRGRVMGDDTALAELNAIVHPAVRQRRDSLMRDALERGDAVVVNDIPLLFEALDPAAFDVVVLVDAPVPVRRARLRTLRGLSNEDADRMIAAQMPAERKRPKSDFVIENAGTLADLERAARHVWDELRRRAARTGGVDWTSVVVAATDVRDSADLLKPLAARCAEAGIPVVRASPRSGALLKTLRAQPPGATVATQAAREAAERAWRDAGTPGRFYWLEPTDRGGAVQLDLRPWGGTRLRLGVNPFA